MKAGASVSMELRSEEVLALRQTLNDLQTVKDGFGVPEGSYYFVAIKKHSDVERSFETAFCTLVGSQKEPRPITGVGRIPQAMGPARKPGDACNVDDRRN